MLHIVAFSIYNEKYSVVLICIKLFISVALYIYNTKVRKKKKLDKLELPNLFTKKCIILMN